MPQKGSFILVVFNGDLQVPLDFSSRTKQGMGYYKSVLHWFDRYTGHNYDYTESNVTPKMYPNNSLQVFLHTTCSSPSLTEWSLE